ncbi:hypothetical protein PR202_ga20526 [Eleusine coracana subsp. coracana]|uniref:Uncharacterized protein n=1 Tax=Eleusine coracana subsp. coracana TaxID=191504 RepID=A0AAV5CYW9_ELECO|nr:hypothetical protein PR202_ga20526 [Eleusine coracana subsp. coracana]
MTRMLHSAEHLLVIFLVMLSQCMLSFSHHHPNQNQVNSNLTLVDDIDIVSYGLLAYLFHLYIG